MTGSIGVFYGKADVSGLLEKIGVTIDTYKTAPRADAESLFRGFTPDERGSSSTRSTSSTTRSSIAVAEGRGMTKSAIDAVGSRPRVDGPAGARAGTWWITWAGMREALARRARRATWPTTRRSSSTRRSRAR